MSKVIKYEDELEDKNSTGKYPPPKSKKKKAEVGKGKKPTYKRTMSFREQNNIG